MNFPNELLDYVGRADHAYQWKLAGGDGKNLFELELVSQQWQGIVWRHRLQVFIPDEIRYRELGVLSIRSSAGGESETQEGHALAHGTGMVWAYLHHVPNQPLFQDLIEDALIAHTLVQYLDTEDPSWPLLFPMVKSAARALDAIQELLHKQGRAVPARFVATGASKRGWTSWLLPVVDSRLAGIIPVVYDNLNLIAQMPHQVEVWGDYSEQIGDYTRHGLQQKMSTERGRRLTAILDPYSYRSALALPKLIVNGANDRYWATDALNLYWENLEGPKSVLYNPNEGHSFSSMGRFYQAGAAFLRAVAEGRSLPPVRGSFSTRDGIMELLISTDAPTLSAHIWTAESPTSDFRMSVWKETALSRSSEENGWAGKVSLPTDCSFAAFGEVLFEGEGENFSLSTPPFLVKHKI